MPSDSQDDVTQGCIDLLTEIGADKFTIKEDKYGTKIQCTCPLHNESNPSFMVRPDSYVWSCFVCGSGIGLPYLVKKVLTSNGKACSIARATSIVLNHVNVVEKHIKKAVDRDYSLRPIDSACLYAYPFTEKVRAYCNQRNITPSVVKAHCLGFDRFKDRLTIPIFDRDHLPVAFVGRAFKKKAAPRYYVYDNKPKEFLLLGIHNIDSKKPSILVEGPFDYLRLKSCKVIASQYNILCSLGSKLSTWQLEVLLNLKHPTIIAMYDNDDAGANGILALLKEAKDRKNILIPCYLPSHPDPGAMTDQMIIALVSGAKPPWARKLKRFD